MNRFLALTAIVAAVMAAPAAAQEGDVAGFDSPEFQAFLGSDYMDRLRRENIQRSMVLHLPECLDLPEFEVVETWPVDPVEMVAGTSLPIRGMWRERLLSSACGESSVENMVHTFTEEGQRTFMLIRGTTRTDLQTQLALIGEAREAAASHDDAEGCDIIRFTNSSILNEYGPTHWGERWQADACGRSVRLDIAFNSVAGSETSYSISLVD